MRRRHIPRLCATCQAPMGRQEDTCWRCGAEWASEEAPPTALRVIAGTSGRTLGTPVPVIAVGTAEAVPQAAAGGRR